MTDSRRTASYRTMMTGEQFRQALGEIGRSPRSFAEWCGLDRTAVLRWVSQNRVPLWASKIVKGEMP